MDNRIAKRPRNSISNHWLRKSKLDQIDGITSGIWGPELLKTLRIKKFGAQIARKARSGNKSLFFPMPIGSKLKEVIENQGIAVIIREPKKC